MTSLAGCRICKERLSDAWVMPWQRFGEDALRILRAVRFAAQLGFEIEENTKKAIVELAPTLSKNQCGTDSDRDS